jgi:hypothetical protein
MNASVLARRDERFAQGAFCPELRQAMDVPRSIQKSLTINFGNRIKSGAVASTNF